MIGRILVVDDDRALCDLLVESLGRRDYRVAACTSAGHALATLDIEDPDVVVTDLHMAGMGGIELCTRIAGARPDLPVIVLTAFGSLETAVAAIRAGAYDFITKPVGIDELTLTLDRALQHHALRREVRRLREAVAASSTFEEMVGASEPMRRAYDIIDRVADSETTVLVTGESGTGKELAARALHRRSRRRDRPFVAVDCSAIPEPLFESHLFGHVKGSFTDARTDHPGLVVQADGGTLFLDELGELPLAVQPRLLRALQERALRPVGGTREIPFDVRIIAATNRDLEAAVEDGRFRQDLFYRIHVIHIELPPLRSRGSDVLLLAQRFLESFARRAGKRVTGFSVAAAGRLVAYAWPGNVRELQNCVERAVALTRGEEIGADDLPDRIREYRSSDILVAGTDASELPPMEEVERRYVLRVLEAAGGSRTLAARVLGFDRKTLYRKLLRYGVAADPSTDPPAEG